MLWPWHIAAVPFFYAEAPPTKKTDAKATHLQMVCHKSIPRATPKHDFNYAEIPSDLLMPMDGVH